MYKGSTYPLLFNLDVLVVVHLCEMVEVGKSSDHRRIDVAWEDATLISV